MTTEEKDDNEIIIETEETEKHLPVLVKKGSEDFKKKKRRTRIKNALRLFFNLEHDTAEYDTIRERIVDGGRVTGTNMCVLVLAILIASIGLNMNSTAVIIGAMLISPIMGTIQAMAYADASGDSKMFSRSARGFLFQVLFSILTSTVYFLLSPISTPTAELIARTEPSIWDVLIALFGGLAGIIGITRKEKSNVIPGVAIATALMPPLCTCGYGIATLQPRFILGAFYLFFVNTYFIFLSAAIVLTILRIPRLHDIDPKKIPKVKHRMIRNTIIIIIPSLIFAAHIIYNNQNPAEKVNYGNSDVPAIISQMETMYPEVKAVEIDASGDENADVKYSVCLDTDGNLSNTDINRINKWLASVLETDSENISVVVKVPAA